MTAAEKYAKKVVKGKLVVSSFIHQAAARFLSLLEREDIFFDVAAANKVVDWFEANLLHWEGEWRGQPFVLEEWQKFILQQIFGLKKDGRRLITKAYIEVARKNAKTTLSAGITLYHMFADTEASPQVLVGANNEDQAKLCTTCAANILEISPNFKPYLDKEIIRIYKYRDKCTSITYRPKSARVEAISRDLKTKDGTSPSLGIIDEYHEADTPGLLNVLRSGQGARKEPLLIVITTAGFRKDGPCYSQLRRTAVEILEGIKEDDSQLAVIYEPDVGDDWQDENTWVKANPNYGVSVYKHYLKDRFVEARNEGASKEVDFKTKNLNIWTDASTVWIPDHVWMKNDAEPDKELVYYGGLDIGYKRDWSAFALIGEQGGFYSCHVWFWIPEETIMEKEKNEHSNLRDWINKGLVFTTPGNVTDHDSISKFIKDLSVEYDIKQVLADPAHCVSIINQLNSFGIETLELTQTRAKLTPPINLLYELALEGKIKHGGNPVLRWMVSNVVLNHSDSNDLVYLSKEKGNESGKIDGIDAMVNALKPFLEEDEPPLFFGYA